MPDARSRYTQRCSQRASLCDAATRYHQYSSSRTSDDGFLCRRTASMEHAADTTEAAAVDHYFPSSTENSSVAVYLRSDADTGIQTDDLRWVLGLSVGGAMQIPQLQIQLQFYPCRPGARFTKYLTIYRKIILYFS